MEHLGELYAKYPKIFVQMKEGFFAISSGVPDAWIQTLDWMCGAIQAHIDNRNEHNPHLPPIMQVVCDQVKDKYGGLRFYFHGGNETHESIKGYKWYLRPIVRLHRKYVSKYEFRDSAIDGMVDMAEYILWETCERCGSHDNLTTTQGWIRRVCDKCKEK